MIRCVESRDRGLRDSNNVTVLIEKLVFYVSYKKIGVAGSHFCAHSYTIKLLIIVTGEWKTV